MPVVDRNKDLAEELRDLKGALRIFQLDHINDLKRIDNLEEQLHKANLRIQELEVSLARYTKVEMNNPEYRSLLICVGPDAKLQIDLTSLRKVKTQTGLNFSRVLNVNFSNLKDTLSRARKSERPVRYLHLAVHASAEGLQFSDGVVTGQQLSEVLQDILVMVIAGCESTEIGDLVGVVPVVVTMRESIGHKDAADFTEVFWIEIGKGVNPEDAFYNTLERVPAVAEFAEIHL